MPLSLLLTLGASLFLLLLGSWDLKMRQQSRGRTVNGDGLAGMLLDRALAGFLSSGRNDPELFLEEVRIATGNKDNRLLMRRLESLLGGGKGPMDRIWAFMGFLKAKEGNTVEAMALYRQALSCQPDCVMARRGMIGLVISGVMETNTRKERDQRREAVITDLADYAKRKNQGWTGPVQMDLPLMKKSA